MAKDSIMKDDLSKFVDNTKYVKVNVNDELKKSFIAYAMAVNVSRAIPDVRDGLKPVHRRILYSMGEINLTSDKPYKKCAKIVGEVLGKYHPHGDSSVYDALVRLAQDFSIRYPLVDGQGNFGSVDGDPAAAYRYTEARLSKISNEMLRDIDKETVDFYPNFDDTEMQPKVLPSRFPNLLVNGSDGIAVGMATNIPPHNLGEVINGIFALIDNPDIDIDELCNIIPAPDYPTGGVIMGKAAIRQAYRTGHGGVVIRAKCEIEEDKNDKHKIVITQLPYQVNKSKLIQQIAGLVKDKKIEGISDVKEESDRHGLRVVIEVKKDAQPQVVLNLLFKHTQLQISNGITFLALVNGEPKILNLKEMLFYYLEHQKEVITRRVKFDLEKAVERQHIIDGLVIALANIDDVISIIRSSIDRQNAQEKLKERYAFSDKQVNAILDMKLQRLTSLEIKKLQEELAFLTQTCKELKSILETPSKVLEIIKTELQEIKEKYDDGRKTEINLDYGDIDISDLIDREDVVVSLTHLGYIKRIPVSEYKSQHRGGRGLTGHKPKDNDFVEEMFVSSTHDDLYFFTNKGKVFAMKAYEIPEFDRNARGRAIVNLLMLEADEKVNTIIPVRAKEQGFLFMATKKGLVKKTAIEEFDKIRKTGKIAIKLTDDDELVSVGFSDGKKDILVASHSGKCIKFSESDVRPTARDTQGVRSMELAKDDEVCDMIVLADDTDVLTVSTNGFGKRSPQSEYRTQVRGGKGNKAGIFNEKTGKLVNLKQIREDEDVIIITEKGILIRVKASEINKIGRDTQGVKIMNINDGKIATVAVAKHEDEEVEDGENVEADIDAVEVDSEKTE